MLPRNRRLSVVEFSSTYQSVATCGAFVCVHVASPNNIDTKFDKFACTISKKQMRNAVGRGRTRRRLYGAIETICADNSKGNTIFITSPLQFIIRAKKPIDAVSFADLCRDISATLRHAITRHPSRK